MFDTKMVERIGELKKERNAVILAHNYQPPAIQDIADLVGDSYELSVKASQTEAEVIVFCGVHFMAETAYILAPEKTVLLPEKLAGCPLADTITAEQLKEFKQEYPSHAVVTYVNSSAEVKAESYVCVTSSNALKVINSLETDKILFTPDKNLGMYLGNKTEKEVRVWDGYCITHERVTVEEVKRAREEHPDALIIVHPECPPEVTRLADEALSTGGMIRLGAETSYDKIIVGTEMGLIYRLSKENPGKEFKLLSPGLVCPNMKYITLDKVVESLENLKGQVTVPDEIAVKARETLERMISVPSGD